MQVHSTVYVDVDIWSAFMAELETLRAERLELLALAWQVLQTQADHYLIDDYGYCLLCDGSCDEHSSWCIVRRARAILAPLLFPEVGS